MNPDDFTVADAEKVIELHNSNSPKLDKFLLDIEVKKDMKLNWGRASRSRTETNYMREDEPDLGPDPTENLTIYYEPILIEEKLYDSMRKEDKQLMKDSFLSIYLGQPGWFWCGSGIEKHHSILTGYDWGFIGRRGKSYHFFCPADPLT